MSKLHSNGSTFSELVLEIFRLNGLLLEAGDRLTEPVGLSSARWQVLGVVDHGAIPVAHVARVMGLTRQSVQQTADALHRDGLIDYLDNPHHRRAKLMALTPKGREALDYVKRHHAEWADRIGTRHSLEDLQTAITVLRHLSDTLRQDSPTSDNDEMERG
jgi:DNA-binding MarR family transcriptional regulator